MSGKMFHQWGEVIIRDCKNTFLSFLLFVQAINARLEEFNRRNRQKLMDLDLSDEGKQKDLAQNDEEEDFLDDGKHFF